MFQYNLQYIGHRARETFIRDCLQQINENAKQHQASVEFRLITNRNKLAFKSSIQRAYPWNTLTQRESQCIEYRLKNNTYQQIGNKINLSKRTIEFYISNIKKKVNCKMKKELIALFQAPIDNEGLQHD